MGKQGKKTAAAAKEATAMAKAAPPGEGAVVVAAPAAPDEGQANLLAKISQLEQKAAPADLDNDPEWIKIAKARKKQAKELKALWEGDGEDKATAIHAICLQQAKELARMEKDLLISKRTVDALERQNEVLGGENNRLGQMKEKLHTLCTELQKQNKTIVAESKASELEQHQKRKELSDKFHGTVTDIASKLEEQGSEREKQFRENDELREKIKYFAEQYEVRENHFAQQLKTKDLECQLLEAKLNQAEEIGKHDKATAEAYKKEAVELCSTEIALREQLASYGEKFEVFQETLTKSNEVLSMFKADMDKMSKTIRGQEKDKKALMKQVIELQGKAGKSDVTLIELVEERDKLRGDVKRFEVVAAQKDKLEGLCRLLQSQVKELKGAGEGGDGAGEQAAAAA